MSLFKKLLKKIELDEVEQTDPWSNEDIRPVPLELQTWREFGSKQTERNYLC